MSHEKSLTSSPKILNYSENIEIFVGGGLAAPCWLGCVPESKILDIIKAGLYKPDVIPITHPNVKILHEVGKISK